MRMSADATPRRAQEQNLRRRVGRHFSTDQDKSVGSWGDRQTGQPGVFGCSWQCSAGPPDSPPLETGCGLCMFHRKRFSLLNGASSPACRAEGRVDVMVMHYWATVSESETWVSYLIGLSQKALPWDALDLTGTSIPRQAAVGRLLSGLCNTISLQRFQKNQRAYLAVSFPYRTRV
ncbi:hypothetical protein ASPSYDRAFT_343181 [Aspergillus sydowii CBS 593.65]|jgi:hypothetical protein|uniref:Uncharacterized protein n=1 Tax=Aspergillus sydowii CBS 593.65 TaxID=1036612 RepID=A0A1L9TZN1_9EURO|nr:uncharacterized protein ASPSYDRAFT_343181 [Aspergillus sydowii CBS 593.65]OJJ64733.1 hypothetical protein ASPSYDRAFT_343181 [Aspergillus sydowii CBS 593.65]